MDAPYSTDHIALDMHICDQRRGYRVRLEGPRAEDMALAYVKARWSTHAVHEAQADQLDAHVYPRLYDLLYPLCEHGLSADLCAGPQHYPYDEDELRYGRGY